MCSFSYLYLFFAPRGFKASSHPGNKITLFPTKKAMPPLAAQRRKSIEIDKAQGHYKQPLLLFTRNILVHSAMQKIIPKNGHEILKSNVKSSC